jgi:lauroyl/myristoyl acyltransferase
VLRDRVLGPFFDRRELCAVNRIVRVSDDSSLAYLRPVLESLRANAVVCITADGRAGHRFVSHDFLNHSIRFATGGVSLARLSGAALIPMFCYQGDGQGLILALESPVDLAPETSRDESADRATQHFVDLLTTYVERHPTQYRNWHLLATS